jgi:hypothetical protein
MKNDQLKCMAYTYSASRTEDEAMKWILVRSLPYTHEFELDDDERVELKLSCRESEIMYKLRVTFGRDVEADLSMLKPE